MSEGSQEGVHMTPYIDPLKHTGNIGGIDYHLREQKQIKYLPILGWIITIHCLLLDMAEEH